MLGLVLAALASAALAACGASRGVTSDVEYIALDDRALDRDHRRPTRPPVRRAIPPTSRSTDGSLRSPWRGRLAERCREVEPLMRVAAMEHGVDVGLIAGIIRTESTFDPSARSHRGATGLMQVMPTVGRRLSCGDLRDPPTNIRCGLTVLTRFLAHYDDDLIYGLSAYNAGYRIPNEARAEGTVPANMSYVEAVLGHRTTYLRHGCGE